ncbi:TetR/AcrR family transcriptional regulator [Ilumatobacter coccineus]|uniref:Putative TetR family transcriptional regulator n=1 Tax=Ilumatobacter coccineus (strain NBRC 103263 / KCTC 29153 / YM16-304) TaxID=1313172 RepID=A0A6C7EAG1_ILUCY|nr:TetR/AcrR family transcriptional regulator [Ilumatobacter coccineus]BAN01618.1 putative TetR family transcriptional regulator [Ilumatobacter coccineus YM16-304]
MNATPAAASDGRSQRRVRNRDAALDSLIDLFAAGAGVPTVDEVAAHAGLSVRSIYRYFEDRDALIRAGITRLIEHAAPLLEFTTLGIGPFAERVERFVDHRLALYEEFGSVALTAARGAASDPVVAELFEIGSMMLRQQFVDHFDAELGDLSPLDRTRATTIATLAFQFEAFEFLHTSLHGRHDDVRAVLIDQLTLNLGRFRARSAD